MPDVEPVVLDANGFFDHFAGEGGLRRADVDALTPRVTAVVKELGARREAGTLPFYRLPYDITLIENVSTLADELRDAFDTLVVLGIGGSALGAKAALEAVAPVERGMRVEVLDNVDPATIGALLDDLELERTVFNVISKSGETAETMAQFMIVRDLLSRRVGPRRYRAHLVATTDPERGILREIADDERLRSLPVPAGVGGRFSVLSAVGLLPMAAAGLDVARVCEGARSMDVRTSLADLWSNPAALHATLLYMAANERGANVHVLMPYCDGLLRVAEWYGQLWAESLGKRLHLDGTLARVGQTPVRALGATDQHSQVQLYVEGPHDKVVTFLRVEHHDRDIPIPRAYEHVAALSYLGGHTLGELLNMEQRATEIALADAGQMTSTLVIERLEEAVLGQLFHLFEIQTLVAAGLLGVDGLDQPGVEAGKRMTCAMAGRGGYEETDAAVRARMAAKRSDLVLA